MPEGDFDPEHFFDHFSSFVETSETGRTLDRLNARYLALIHENRELIKGSSVLDLASHDGRFSFAALQNGATTRSSASTPNRASSTSASANMEHYGVAPDRYDFVNGDMFQEIEAVEPCDVVFCFGILYHINDHMLLLSKIAESRSARGDHRHQRRPARRRR